MDLFFYFISTPFYNARFINFEIKSSNFYRDGKPIKLISGAVHYCRNVLGTWDDIFEKLKALGYSHMS